MIHRKHIFWLALMALLAIGCQHEKELEQAEKDNLAAFVANYEAANGIALERTSGGVYYRKGKTGLSLDTLTLAKNDAVSIYYKGYYVTGAKSKALFFETSTDAPYTFTYGTDEMIAGWEEILGGALHQGDSYEILIVPSWLAYGEIKNGAIPAYSTLVFEPFEVMAVNKAAK